MSAAIYTTDNITEPMQVQEDFATQYALDDPVAAVEQYAKIMKEHTKRQMALASSASRRRGGNDNSPVDATASLAKEESISSRASSVNSA